MFDPNASYTIQYLREGWKKSGCKYVTRIPRGVSLTDDQVRLYFHIDETSRYWHTMHLPRAYARLVFNRCAFPEVWHIQGHISVTIETT